MNLYTLANGMVYDCGDPKSVMEDALKAANWSDKAAWEAKRKDARARGKLYGRGLASYVEWTSAMVMKNPQGLMRDTR